MIYDSLPALSEVDRRIATRLKERREVLGLSLNDLAARSGVSRAMISKVERCAASPTAALLGRLCNGLGITLSGLMASAERAITPLTRAEEQPTWHDPDTGLVRVAISPSGTRSTVEIVRIDLPSRTAVAYEAQRHLDYEQHVLVLQGRLTLTLGAQRFDLRTGDCLYMRLTEPVSFVNEEDALCRYLVVLKKDP